MRSCQRVIVRAVEPAGPPDELSPAEVEQLAHEEAIVEDGIIVFFKVGMALARIRDQRLYRAGHGTFEEYVDKRWHMSRTHAYRLIESGEVVTALSPIGDIPQIENEGQARAIAPIVRESGPEAAAEILREVEATEGAVTARGIKAKAKAKTKKSSKVFHKNPLLEQLEAQANVEQPEKVKATVVPEPESEPIKADTADIFEADPDLFEDIEVGVQSILFAVEHADTADVASQWVAARGSTLTSFDLKRAARELEKVATFWESQ